MTPLGPPALELTGIHASYGGTVALRGVDLVVPERAIVALLGPNGAGKTSLMKVASGLLSVDAGHVRIGGEDVTGAHAKDRTRRGLTLIPEGRGIFRSLTVRENLDLFRPAWTAAHDLDEVTEIFPVLARRIDQTAGTLSGGEQQMLALSRAFLARPSVVLVDEVSVGLAPKIVDQIFEIFARLAKEGISLLVVEQYVRRALDLADDVYLLNRGEIVLSGTTDEVGYDDIALTYLT
jgi:branched-chain amino acid transport system ATP-binding protein